jgi:predicted restriction endonuclease
MRIGQDLYRAKLLEMWGGRCAITGVSCPDLLRASHAKPWKDANDHERLDPYNGFLLEARFDVLFDQGYISFNDEGSIIISPQLSHEDQLALGFIPTPLALKKLHPKHHPYLRWHREHVFRR